MSYVDFETEFLPYLKDNSSYDQASRTVKQAALNAAEEGINTACRRKISLVSADPASTRRFRATCGLPLIIHDAATITEINGAAITSRCLPLPVDHLDELTEQWRPYSRIKSLDSWTLDDFGFVSVTGTWGWVEIPVQAKEACKILGKDVLSNRDVSFGIAAFTEYAAIRARENPQVAELIEGLRGPRSVLIA